MGLVLSVEDLITYAISMIIAVFGGSARFVYFSGKRKFTLKEFFFAQIVSAFTGWLAYLVSLLNTWDTPWTIIFIAIAGYTAPALVDALALTMMHIGKAMKPPEVKPRA